MDDDDDDDDDDDYYYYYDHMYIAALGRVLRALLYALYKYKYGSVLISVNMLVDDSC